MRGSVLVAVAAGAAALAVPAAATFPGTSGRLVFERPTSDGTGLFSAASDGSGLTRLTNRKGMEGDASWSPDGSKVTFLCGKHWERGRFEICSINADGSGFAQLTRHGTFSTAPAWSPDGSKIVYEALQRAGDHWWLHVMNADGSGKQRLTGNRGGTYSHADPQWSPDGATIAIGLFKEGVTSRAFDCGIALIDADGGNLRRLTPRGGPDELNPNWSPDGTKIAFEVNQRFPVRQSDIWLINADGSGKQRLTKTRFYETNPVFSPDGRRIAFTGDRDNRNLSKRRLRRGFEVYTMAADGGDLIRVTDNRQAEWFPDWQPLP